MKHYGKPAKVMVSRFFGTGRASIATPSPSGDAQVDFRDFFGILRARLPLVVAPTLIVLVLAVLYVVVATRVYTGVTSILIDTRVRTAVGDTANTNSYSPDAVLVESQVRLISSDTVLRRVVETERLVDDPEFAPGRAGLRTRLLAAFGFAGAAPPSIQDVVSRTTISLSTHVVVKRSERTYIADIEVTSADPVKAARLANAVASAYLADQQGARNDAANRDSEWVRGQIAEMETRLRDAELKADAYRREHGIIDTNGKFLNEQELSDASASLTLARTKATEAKSRLDQIHRILAAGRNVDSLPDALKSPVIDKLRGQYADTSRQQATLRQTLGDRHPALLESQQQLQDIRRLIIEELSRVQAGIANESQTAQDNVAALERHVQDLKQMAGVSNENRVRADELQRDVDARRAVYDRFLRARDTVREQAVDAPVGRVIAPAVAPTAPSSPKTFAVLALAFAAGLGLGIGSALVVDMMSDDGRAEPTSAVEPVVAVDGPPGPREPVGTVAVQGLVPSPFGNAVHLSARGWLLDRMRTAWPTTIDAEHVPSLPAFRSAVQALGLLDPVAPDRARAGPTTLLVTSLPGRASRTTLSLGLAEAAAAQGKRALVVDADHESALIRELVAPGARPALIDLMGTTRLCYRIMAPYRGSLSVVPLMPGEAQIARRLETQATTTRIDGIAENFEFVVFDGPSVGHAERLGAMAASVDAVILVAPRDTTQGDAELAVAGLDLPETCIVRVVLAVDLPESGRSSEAA